MILVPHDFQKPICLILYNPSVSKIVFQEIYVKYTSKNSKAHDKLLEGKEYLNGKFSSADQFHYPPTHYAHITNHSDLWDKIPNVKNREIDRINKGAWKKSLKDIKS
ncbi:10120_t:CDS:1 [Scutellospora calospora]|uniref:10120_t:CDS:1 n=1 Tax=Scutellospora calospora TaxID=85575 RepID=A0ACA9KYT9_9GLOM|nr:10120_t:CDS:1 [Scutellospora calospora]